MNKSTESKAKDTQPQVNEQRRRLTRGGLAAPIVLGTLLSRPVLGAAPYNCTISGKLSGNTSSHGDPVECGQLGRSPGYWRQDQKDWPAGLIYGSGMIDGSFKPIAIPTGDEDTEGTLLTTAGFAKALEVKEETLTTTVRTGFGRKKSTKTITETVYKIASYPNVSPDGNATLLQIVAAGGNDNKLVSLARAAVASLLNARQFAPDYPLTEDQVVAMFNAVYAGGKYQVNATTAWDQDQVKAYFESLYNA
ncbi:MAG: hypothetical protein MUE59_08495 [Thiobacillaceae bacterium]|nr:hypothetical protein [Thiobacillaceae bacterium]